MLEEFQEPADANAAIIEVVSRAVSPASEIGGDARLILPDERRIKSEVAEHDGLVSGLPVSLQLMYRYGCSPCHLIKLHIAQGHVVPANQILGH